MIVKNAEQKKVDIYSVYVEAWRSDGSKDVLYFVVGKIYRLNRDEILRTFCNVDDALAYKDELKTRLNEDLDIPFAPEPGEPEEAAYD